MVARGNIKGVLVMSPEILLKIRKMGKEVKKKRQGGEINFEYMTALCGLPFEMTN